MPEVTSWKDIARGFLDAHSRLNAGTAKVLEASSFVYSLIELLHEKGLISIEELDARQKEVAARLEEQLRSNGVSVILQEPEQDKYQFTGEVEIDCGNRVAQCHAACCKLPFALSRQDIREGVVHWDLGNPYVIAHGEDGYCDHMDRGCGACTVREQRPLPCRAYDCRKEKRIWLDFENRVINPGILHPEWPYNAQPDPETVETAGAGARHD